MTPHVERKRRARKQRILESAVHAFRERGYHGTSVADIARALHLTASTTTSRTSKPSCSIARPGPAVASVTQIHKCVSGRRCACDVFHSRKLRLIGRRLRRGRGPADHGRIEDNSVGHGYLQEPSRGRKR